MFVGAPTSSCLSDRLDFPSTTVIQEPALPSAPVLPILVLSHFNMSSVPLLVTLEGSSQKFAKGGKWDVDDRLSGALTGFSGSQVDTQRIPAR